MMRRISLSVVLVCVALVGWGQVDYQAQYKNGKDLFREGKYNLAMEAFKPLIPYDDENPYSAYASFYYALSAYRQNYPAAAKDMLLQIKKVHPKWEKMDEVNLWLAIVYRETDDYFQGVRALNEVNEQNMV